MSPALDWREKIFHKKGYHPMLEQPILSQKKDKTKFFKQPILKNCNLKKVALYKKGPKAVTSLVYMVLEALFVV